MMTKRKVVAITLTFIALGYVGAAVSYSYLIGLNIDFPYLCPVCPEIVSFGSPTGKFIGRTVGLGTLNAIVLAAAGWLLIATIAGMKKLFSRG
jgi:hypothetical protein